MSLWDHLPVLVVIIPLLAGPVCVLAERPLAAWGIATAAAWLSFAAAVALADDPVHGQHLGVLLVELGVGIAVFSVVLLIFYAFSGRRRRR